MARDFIGVQRGSTQTIDFSSSAHSRDSDQYFWSPVPPEVMTDAASQSTYHKSYHLTTLWPGLPEEREKNTLPAVYKQAPKATQLTPWVQVDNIVYLLHVVSPQVLWTLTGLRGLTPK